MPAITRTHRPPPGVPIEDLVDQGLALEVSGRYNGHRRNAVIGPKVGLSGTTFQRAKAVVLTARDRTLPPEHQTIARDALDLMNKTGQIYGAYNRVRPIIRSKRMRPDTSQRITQVTDQRRALNAASATGNGVAAALRHLDDIHPDIDVAEADRWLDSLSDTRRVIEKTINRLRKHIHDNS